jgi:hypothetical protein
MSVAPLLGGRAPELGGVFHDLAPLHRFLEREHGWTAADLARNQLPARAPLDEAGARAHARFWGTIALAARRLEGAGILPVTIKSLRTYAFWDSNADLLIPAGSRARALQALYAGPWVAPSRRSRLEQALVERAKIKLPSQDPEYRPVHLYEGISWRYQADIGLLTGAEHTASRLVPVPAAVFAGTRDQADPPVVRVPDDATELVLQAAHAAYENFRLSLGEAVHLHLLRRVPGVWERAQGIARVHGCAVALDEVMALCEGWVAGELGWNPAAFPLQIPLPTLARCYRERAAFLLGRRRVGSAAVEIGGFAWVFPVIRAVRRVRRARAGRAVPRAAGVAP